MRGTFPGVFLVFTGLFKEWSQPRCMGSFALLAILAAGIVPGPAAGQGFPESADEVRELIVRSGPLEARDQHLVRDRIRTSGSFRAGMIQLAANESDIGLQSQFLGFLVVGFGCNTLPPDPLEPLLRGLLRSTDDARVELGLHYLTLTPPQTRQALQGELIALANDTSGSSVRTALGNAFMALGKDGKSLLEAASLPESAEEWRRGVLGRWQDSDHPCR